MTLGRKSYTELAAYPNLTMNYDPIYQQRVKVHRFIGNSRGKVATNLARLQ